MIDLDFVQKLIRTVDESSIDTVEIERGGTRIRLSKTPEASAAGTAAPAPQSAAPGNSPAPSPAPAPTREESAGEAEAGDAPRESPDENLVEVTSPMVGTFYRAPSPGADPFTEVGATVEEGDTLCIIEAMKLMNELESEMAGTVREVCVENGEPVEYGQVLFRVEPA